MLGALGDVELLPDDYLSNTLARRPPTPQSLRQPLGAVGNAHVPSDLWFSAGSPSRMPPHPPHRSTSAAALPLLQTLASQGLLVPCAVAKGSSAFVLFKTPDKARLIVNCKAYTCLFARSPAFALPSFDRLYALPILPIYFIKIDLSNFFLELDYSP